MFGIEDVHIWKEILEKKNSWLFFFSVLIILGKI